MVAKYDRCNKYIHISKFQLIFYTFYEIITEKNYFINKKWLETIILSIYILYLRKYWSHRNFV